MSTKNNTLTFEPDIILQRVVELCCSYRDISDKAKVSFTSIVKAMNGEPLSITTAGRIAKALDLDVKECFTNFKHLRKTEDSNNTTNENQNS